MEGTPTELILHNKVKKMKTKPDPNFLLDEISILGKVIKLKYTVEPTIVVPRKLTSLTILEFHNAKSPPRYQLHCEHDETLFLMDRHA